MLHVTEGLGSPETLVQNFTLPPSSTTQDFGKTNNFGGKCSKTLGVSSIVEILVGIIVEILLGIIFGIFKSFGFSGATC